MEGLVIPWSEWPPKLADFAGPSRASHKDKEKAIEEIKQPKKEPEVAAKDPVKESTSKMKTMASRKRKKISVAEESSFEKSDSSIEEIIQKVTFRNKRGEEALLEEQSELSSKKQNKGDVSPVVTNTVA